MKTPRSADSRPDTTPTSKPRLVQRHAEIARQRRLLLRRRDVVSAQMPVTQCGARHERKPSASAAAGAAMFAVAAGARRGTARWSGTGRASPLTQPR